MDDPASRGTGRTTKMIMALPDAGAIIITPSIDIARYVSQMVLELRGPDFDKRCKVVAIRHNGDTQRIMGYGLAIAFDHTFDVMTPRAFAEEVKAYARAVNHVYWPLAA